MTIAHIHQLFLKSTGVSTDTRKINKGNLFFALKGENFDGNLYAKKAIESGASYAIVDDENLTDPAYIIVDDVLKTLQNLSTFHRRYLNIPVLALTGSNGKTTTKELITTVLARKFKVTATKGNLNNHIGVPLTLLSFTKETEIGVVEMGANHQKEIDFLCHIAEPDYGYITNIGKAHLEGFGGLEGVLKGKTELYRYLLKNNGKIFLNLEDEKLSNAARDLEKVTFAFSEKIKSDYTISLIKSNPMVAVSFENQRIQSNLTGTYNFSNICAAVVIGGYFKISTEKIKAAIESYVPSNNRSQLVKKESYTVLLDAYNANPSSMQAAIENFEELEAPYKIVHLGDMFELGEDAIIEHQFIADLAAAKGFDKIFLIGEHFNQTEVTSLNVQKYRTFEDFQQIPQEIPEHSYILIKGSRGMKMERILSLLPES